MKVKGPSSNPPRAPASAPKQAGAPRTSKKSAAPHTAPHTAAKQQALTLPPQLPASGADEQPGALAAFARALETEATLTPSRADKAHKLDDALLAWLGAALDENATASSRTHGAQQNAELAAARLGAFLDAPGPRLIAQATARALDADLDGARALFLAAREQPLSFLQGRAVTRALRVLDDARGAIALDRLSARLANAPAFVSPRDVAHSIGAEAAALAREHPSRALDFAALSLEAHARAGTVREQLPALLTLIKDSGRAQSATRTPSVAHKALLLATANELAGNTTGARAAYRRVLEMAHATPAELRGAHAALAKLAAARGDEAEAQNHAGALRALVGDLSFSSTSGAQSPFQTQLLSRDVQKDLTRALDVRSARDLGPAFVQAVDVLAAAPLARAAEIPLSLLLHQSKGTAPFSLPGGAHPVALLVALRTRDIELLPPVPAARELADDGTQLFGGLLKSHRGDTSTLSKAPLALTFGLLAALAATDKRVGVHAPGGAARVPSGAPPDAHGIAAAQSELESLIADRTHGPPTLSDARARLRAHGWKPERGSSALIKDGMRIRFETFSIAQTAAFHAHLDVRGAEDGRASLRTVAHTVHIGALAFSDDEWGLFDAGFSETIERYQANLEHAHLHERRLSNIDQIRRLLSLGRPVSEIPEKREELLALYEKTQHAKALLAELKASGKAPRAIYIGVEGIDAASKTSNGMRIKAIAEENGYAGRWLSFKGPTAEERAQPWLTRYQKQAPGDGEVFLSDRTFLGDYAYNPGATPERMQQMAADVAAWQAQLKKDGALVLNLLFDPRMEDGSTAKDEVLERPMTTFGKREARALIARDLLERHRASLTDDERASLEAATLGPGYNDLKSFHEGAEAMERFHAFADAIEAHGGSATFVRIGTKTRQDGRARALDALITQLEALRDA